MTFAEMHVKWSVTLTYPLGPDILTVLEIMAQLLHRVRLHVKVPGWFSLLNALLPKKLHSGWEFFRLPNTAMAKGTLCRTMAHPASRASFISFLRAVAVHVRYK